jgi:L-lactate dehydrogenase complex protein LldE
MAIHTLDILDATEGAIVVPSGSCAAMIVAHYPELFADTEYSDVANRVADRVRELSQFLVDDLGVTGFDSVCDDCKFTIHKSCHGLRTLGLRDQINRLVGEVAGAEVIPLDGAEECCGFGGLFSIELPEVSEAIMNTKLDRIEASGAETVIGGDISCLLHIEGGLRRRGSGVVVRHFSEVIGGPDAT